MRDAGGAQTAGGLGEGLGHAYLLLDLLLGPLQLPQLPVELLPLLLVGCNLLLLLGFLLLGLGQLCLQGGHVLHLHAKLWGREGGWPSCGKDGAPPRGWCCPEAGKGSGTEGCMVDGCILGLCCPCPHLLQQLC